MSIPEKPTNVYEVYTITMPDNTLSGDGLFEGDCLYISESMTPINGQIAIVWFDERHYVIRRFYCTDKYARLIASDDSTKPMLIHTRQITGLGVVTRFSRFLR